MRAGRGGAVTVKSDPEARRRSNADAGRVDAKVRSLQTVLEQVDLSCLGTLDVRLPAWLDSGDGGRSVTVRELPLREQIDVPVREQYIVELYSK